MTQSIDLSGKTALVTGASGGIGQAIARALASAGAAVAVHYNSHQEEADELVAELVGNGAKAVAIGANLREAKEIRELYDRAESELGPLDFVVNNAGVGGSGMLTDTDLEKLDLLIDINFRAVVLSLAEAGRRLKEGGAIVNISSMLGDYPLPGTTPYSATKAAVDVLARGAAKEFGDRGISVTSLSPGATLPGMFGKSTEERQKEFANSTPLKRLGEADDIAAMVVFLFSAPGRWINGAVITADGGFSA